MVYVSRQSINKMNFLKNLFKKQPKQPIVQKNLNLGKIKATIFFKDGQTVEKVFEGVYHSSNYSAIFEVWVDFHTTAEKKYQEFLDEVRFIQVDDKTLIPISEIAKITTEYQDYFIETKRGA